MRHNDRPERNTYSVTDLLGDPSFQQWVLHQDGPWQEWITAHPEQAAVLETARQLLLQIRFVNHLPTDIAAEQSLNRFKAAVANMPETSRTSNIRQLFRFRQAAVWTGLIICAGIIAQYTWSQLLAPQRIRTAFGEIKQVLLPDSSLVTLQANSELRYKRSWNKQQREVWLKGEAYFRVHPDKTHPVAGFVVHSIDADVTVLGTEFDLKQRHHQTSVFLKSGKIRIDFHRQKTPGIILQPGDLIIYDALRQQVSSAQTDSTYSSWMHGKLTLINAPLSEIIQILENNYGEKIIVNDNNLLEKRIEGIIYLESKADILFILSNVLDIQISKQNDTMYFSNRK
ncbi:FecR family protein [Chitinophaga sp. HK235]|uniref:FecR family protein n=1 Tax=Chitinophaga sp. HK235 TaxID=2952571 RepID=UPI001BA8C0C8|nr:FecR domain-containing protein [Chitinophaga sp. HK235]